MPDLSFDPPMSRCEFCKSADLVHHFTDFKGIEISLCNHCKVQFMNPQYTSQYLEKFYSTYQKRESQHHRYKSDDEPREYVHNRNIADIEKYVNPGKFLSVGCGAGHDLVVAQRRNWRAEGYEVDVDYAEKLSQRLKMPVHSGNFTEMTFPQTTYDCLYLNHVIEHPKKPAAYLKKCHQLLKDSGALYIACPNIAAFSIKIKKLLEKLGVKNKKGTYYDTWQHLFYYSPPVMKHILAEYGFRVVSVGNDQKFKPDQSKVSRKLTEMQSRMIPYKSSFRMIALKC